MSKTASLTITVSITGDGLNPLTYSTSFDNSNGFGAQGPYALALSAGFNSLTAPTNATTPPKFVILKPASTSTNTKTIKGVTGDTGPAALAWTSQLVILPMGSAGAWGITATAGETIDVFYL